MSDPSTTIPRLALGTAVAVLLLSIVGTLVGLPAYPAIRAIARRANRAIPSLAFAVNALSAVIVLWLLSMAIRRAEASALLERNRQTIIAARLAMIVMIFELIYGFIAGEARALIVVQLGNFTQLDFITGIWAIVLGVVVPALVLMALLVFSPRWIANRTIS